MAERPLETSITLFLEHCDAALSEAHRELYPERIPEQIPFSLTLLYPWIPAADVTEADLEQLRAFFAERPPLKFELTHVAEFPGLVAYAVPEPDVPVVVESQARYVPLAPVRPSAPVRCVVMEATLQEEYELDRMRVRETFRFDG